MTPKYRLANEIPQLDDARQTLLLGIEGSLHKIIREIEHSGCHHRGDYLSQMDDLLGLAHRMGSPFPDFKEKYEEFRRIYAEPAVLRVAEVC